MQAIKKASKAFYEQAANYDETDALVAKFKRSVGDESDEEGYELEGKPEVYYVDRPPFNIFIGVLIATNAVFVGLETDARSNPEHSYNSVSYLVEVIFCLIFTTELLARFYYHGCYFFIIPGMRVWNGLDFLIVLLSIADTFILVPLGSGGDLKFMQMLRFARMMRLIRLVRLFKIFKELWLVASGLIESMKTLVWVCLIMSALCYVFAIFFTNTVGRNDDLYDTYFLETGFDHEMYFATMSRSVLTLLQVLTLSNWSDEIARHVIAQQPWQLTVFLVFIAFGSFGLLNIVVGVVVEHALRTSEKDRGYVARKKEKDRQVIFSRLEEIFNYADTDGSGTLDVEEVETALSKPEVYSTLKMIDFPVDAPETMFTLLDFENTGELSIEEFITGCMRMRGTAKSKDLLAAQVALDTMRRHYTTFEEELTAFNQKLAALTQTTNAIVMQGERVFLSVQEYRMRHPTMMDSTIPELSSEVLRQAPWEQHQSESEQVTPRSRTAEIVPANMEQALKKMQQQGNSQVMQVVQKKNVPDSPQPPSLQGARTIEDHRKHEAPAIEDGLPGAVVETTALAIPKPRY